MKNYKEYIEETAERTGFIRSTLEKVEKLLNILEWISNKEELKDLLAGTAINTAIFNFPRLSVDIDLDFTENLAKDEMIIFKNFMINSTKEYMNQNYYLMMMKL